MENKINPIGLDVECEPDESPKIDARYLALQIADQLSISDLARFVDYMLWYKHDIRFIIELNNALNEYLKDTTS